jgi:hypothetical protein
MPSGGGDDPFRRRDKPLPADRLHDLEPLRRRKRIIVGIISRLTQAFIPNEQEELQNEMDTLRLMDEQDQSQLDMIEQSREEISRLQESLNNSFAYLQEQREELVEVENELIAKTIENNNRSKGEGLLPKKTIRKGGVVYYGTRSIKR